MGEKKLSGFTLCTIMVAMLLSGTATTIFMKAMDTVELDGDQFKHPYFQTASVFFGEFIVLFYYFPNKYLSR